MIDDGQRHQEQGQDARVEPGAAGLLRRPRRRRRRRPGRAWVPPTAATAWVVPDRRVLAGGRGRRPHGPALAEAQQVDAQVVAGGVAVVGRLGQALQDDGLEVGRDRRG